MNRNWTYYVPRPQVPFFTGSEKVEPESSVNSHRHWPDHNVTGCRQAQAEVAMSWQDPACLRWLNCTGKFQIFFHDSQNLRNQKPLQRCMVSWHNWTNVCEMRVLSRVWRARHVTHIAAWILPGNSTVWERWAERRFDTGSSHFSKEDFSSF